MRELFEDEPVRVYVSPYLRALQTLDSLGLDDLIGVAREEPRLREQDWANFQDTEDIERQEALRDSYGHFFYRFTHGESGSDVYDRVSTFLETMHRDFETAGCAAQRAAGVARADDAAVLHALVPLVGEVLRDAAQPGATPKPGSCCGSPTSATSWTDRSNSGRGARTDGKGAIGMVVEQTREAAIDLLGALSAGAAQPRSRRRSTRRTTRTWTYLPGDRPGLPLAELSAAQQALVAPAARAGVCSERGLADALGVMVAEIDLCAVSRRRSGARGTGRVLSSAIATTCASSATRPDFEPWAWRLNGHHLALHVTLVGGAISFTPQFIGSNPAVVLSGPHAGRGSWPPSRISGFQLLHALDAGQREVAVVSPDAPDDILTRHDPVADPALLHRGLAVRRHDRRAAPAPQPAHRPVRRPRRRADRPADLAGHHRARHRAPDLRLGRRDPPGVGHRHYYSIAGPTFLAEYDNTQDDANHIHSVWRDLRNDWGHDLLAAHYAQHR